MAKCVHITGFTILEMVVVIGILGIGLHLATPTLRTILQESRLRTEARVIKETLEELSLQSRLRGQKIFLKIESDNFHAHISTLNSAPFLQRQFPSGVTAHDIKPSSIRLSSSGAVTPASLALSYGSPHCKITVSLRGRVSVRC